MKARQELLCILACVGMIFVAGSLTAEEPVKKEFTADKGPKEVDIGAFPPEVQTDYKVFASKCSKCHTLARPINTNMEAAAWKMYVKRMMNKPDSGISPDQGKTIYRFLKFYQDEKDKKKRAVTN
ncbi:MAG TPA: hypothetical protein VI895_00240 [Bdellovibrionota bacterium]|nr:hypothetical protein [Bdellovibrionota bacterium]